MIPFLSLATEFKNILWEKDLKELTSYAYQLDAEGFSVEINQGQKNDHGLDYIAINEVTSITTTKRSILTTSSWI